VGYINLRINSYIFQCEVIKMEILEQIKTEGFRRRLSHKTIKSYCFYVKKFLLYIGKDPKEVSKKDVREFMEYLSNKELASNTLNVALNSVRFMLEQLLNKKWLINFRYAKNKKKIPTVLTKEEIIRLINAISNKKHKLMVSLAYGAGLRVSELVHLKAEDMKLGNGFGVVRNGKGGKDRLFIIPESLKSQLDGLLVSLKPDNFLFPGNNGNSLSTETVYTVVKLAAKKAGIDKNVHPHTLRHSFATHIIENGYNVYVVQDLLGHSSVETSMVYIHTAASKIINVKSPLDII
jgi:integrase/recombinase XerD